MQDSTLVFITEKLELYAGIIAGKVQEVAPVAYAMVRQRVMLESIISIIAWGVPFILFSAVLVFAIKHEDRDDTTGIIACMAVLCVICLLFITGGILDLLSLDYATVMRMIEMARGE